MLPGMLLGLIATVGAGERTIDKATQPFELILWLDHFDYTVGVPDKVAWSTMTPAGIDTIIDYHRRCGRPTVAFREAKEHGIDLDLNACEEHLLAGGNTLNVVRGLLSAKERGFEFSFRGAAAIDLTARDVTQVVQRLSSGSQLAQLAGEAEKALEDLTNAETFGNPCRRIPDEWQQI